MSKKAKREYRKKKAQDKKKDKQEKENTMSIQSYDPNVIRKDIRVAVDDEKEKFDMKLNKWDKQYIDEFLWMTERGKKYDPNELDTKEMSILYMLCFLSLVDTKQEQIKTLTKKFLSYYDGIDFKSRKKTISKQEDNSDLVVLFKNIDICKLVIEKHKVDPNIMLGGNVTPLILAIKDENKTIFDYLMSLDDIDVNKKTGDSQKHPLIFTFVSTLGQEKDEEISFEMFKAILNHKNFNVSLVVLFDKNLIELLEMWTHKKHLVYIQENFPSFIKTLDENKKK